MLPQEIIVRKRNGGELTAEEIAAVVDGLTGDSFSEAQIAALAMAIYFVKMTVPERVALTEAMTRSGRVLDWSKAGFDGPVLDKHSTGGVGDNVSLMLAPVMAAMGGFVPMISGRGLGHTGGTLDKFDSIPGYTTQPDEDLFRRTVKEAGCAVIGQTADLAPADKRFYAIRDVTGTVESIDLITASILSKKLAAGLDVLVLDVKCGTGAFMATREDARALADSLVSVANGAGMKTSALITDMNEPLAPAAGNAIEMRVAVDYLTGEARDPALHAVVKALCVEMAVLGGLSADENAASEAVEGVLSSGAAAERFQAMVTCLGGPADFVEKPNAYLDTAPVIREVRREGVVSAIDTRALGNAVVALGGGRVRTSDPIDYAVGFSDFIRVGEDGADRPLCLIHARTEDAADRAEAAVRSAIATGETARRRDTFVLERVPPTG
ncbi:MAG: thymidine phosphorylase [Rhodobiaceae bacterium]|nr:thymidine phosphorylase [Rhodobiaceae bacterium]